jgi:hypothetical protein
VIREEKKNERDVFISSELFCIISEPREEDGKKSRWKTFLITLNLPFYIYFHHFPTRWDFPLLFFAFCFSRKNLLMAICCA